MKIIAIVLLLMSTIVFAAEPPSQNTVLPIYPGAAPGSEKWTTPEDAISVPADPGKRIRNVSRPTLTVFLPDPALANGTAVVICPGGAFIRLAIDHEGYQVARWLNTMGIAAFVLKYRVLPTDQMDSNDHAVIQARAKAVIPLAVADGQQAIRFVRSHAAEWGIAPNRIGIMGFSAGGYVTSAVAFDHDAQSRPDFAAPIYGVLADSFTVPADAPPLFIVHGGEDKSVDPLNNSVRLYTAWKQAHISAELHIYALGAHGFGMYKKGLPIDSWTDRFHDWLEIQGLLKKADAKPASATK
jgi:acetyl esterase/lipase